MTEATNVQPKVMAAGIGATVAALIMSAIESFWPDANIPGELQGLLVAIVAFALAWFKKN